LVYAKVKVLALTLKQLTKVFNITVLYCSHQG